GCRCCRQPISQARRRAVLWRTHRFGPVALRPALVPTIRRGPQERMQGSRKPLQTAEPLAAGIPIGIPPSPPSPPPSIAVEAVRYVLSIAVSIVAILSCTTSSTLMNEREQAAHYHLVMSGRVSRIRTILFRHFPETVRHDIIEER